MPNSAPAVRESQHTHGDGTAMSLYFKYHHADIHETVGKLAYETGTPWLLAIGIVGLLLDLASEHEPRGMLPSVDPGYYGVHYHEPKMSEIVALMFKKGMLDAQGRFTDWAKKQASFKTGDDTTSADSERKSKYRDRPSWQKAGWERIWQTAWSQANEKGSRIAWYDTACPWIEQHCSESEDVRSGKVSLEAACAAYVEKNILRSVGREAVLIRFWDAGTGRHPYGLPKWIRMLLWRNPEYNEGWKAAFAKARKAAFAKARKAAKGDGGGAPQSGKRPETAAERNARREDMRREAVARRLQSLQKQGGAFSAEPERVQVRVDDGEAGGVPSAQACDDVIVPEVDQLPLPAELPAE